MDIIATSLIGGILISICLAIIGNFVLWQKISYIGDSIAHSSLLGIVLASIMNYSFNFITIIICFIFAMVFVILHKRFSIAKDSILIFNTQFSLSIGFILLALFSNGKLLNNYLFGNILTITIQDIYIILIILLVLVLFIKIYWQQILLITFNNQIANCENIKSSLFDTIFIFFLSLIITFSIKIIGILLVPSLLILPSLLSTNIAKTAFGSILMSVFVSIISVIFGIGISTIIDIQASPIISLILIVLIVVKIIFLIIWNKFKLSKSTI